MTHVNFHIIQIEVLHISEITQMKEYHNGDHLALAHYGLSLGLIPQGILLNGLIEMLAEFVYKTENLSSFIVR